MTDTRPEVEAAPPVARRDPMTRVIHGRELVDPYHWLRDRDAPEVRAYLEAENAYTARAMRHTEDLQEELFRQMVGRLKQTDASVPVRVDDYWYYSRTVEGLQYSIRCRKHGSLEAPEEVLLDLNALGDGFLALGAFAVSPDHRLLAYSLNDDGSESYTLRVVDLERQEPVGEAIRNTSPSVAWANDNRTFFYVVRDAARRPYRAYRQVLGRAAAASELVFEETDARFFVSLFKTRSRRFVGLHTGSNITDEVHFLDADQPEADFRPLVTRRQGVEVDVDHHTDAFYVLTNQDAINFKLMKAPLVARGTEGVMDDWQEVIPHRPDVQLESIDCFRGHLVVRLRRAGLRQLRILDLAAGDEHEVGFDEPAYTVAARDNPDFESRVLRFAYSSLVTPESIYDYDMTTRISELKKRTQVLGFDRRRFACERVEARAADGTRIPISLVYAGELARDGSRPTLLSAYGAYGASNEPRFVASRLNLLGRGFVFAIAHVRGGGDLGRAWYEDGKLLAKGNTFSDFIAAAEHLIGAGYSSPERLAIRGGSAGGLLIGAVLNQRPDLFAAAIADVPFVDVLNTMLDHSVPLTVTELEEWGDPREEIYFELIRGYSPYENVATQRYPHLLITAGLNDPRVQYWEPAKWTARLRDLKRGRECLLLKVDLDSGHSGASGRYDALRQEAFRQAFILDSLPQDSRGA